MSTTLPANWHTIDLAERTMIAQMGATEKWRSIDAVSFRSSRAFDIGIDGVTADGSKFSAWLPLLAISKQTAWSSPAIAAQCDYPDMALEGDWSAIRDSEMLTIWRIFGRHCKP